VIDGMVDDLWLAFQDNWIMLGEDLLKNDETMEFA
jgi:hypothetical protein